jgi:hypothetical protein
VPPADGRSELSEEGPMSHDAEDNVKVLTPSTSAAAAEVPAELDASALLRSSASTSSSNTGETRLMKIVKAGLLGLATKFEPVGNDDTPQNAAANFIQALNDHVQKLQPAAGGSRRALKRIMKKYSRRVSRKRGKRVKSSAQ